MSNTNLLVSLVIPSYNEAESLPELIEWIARVCVKNNISYEILFIDDGSTDNSWEIINQYASTNSAIRGIQFKRNYGKSAALNEGFHYANGKYIITMDSDLQDSPEEIPSLIQKLEEGKYDIVSGWKRKRYDNVLTKNLPSKLYNSATRYLTHIDLHDFNCGLKIYKKEVVKSIEIYGEMHRYIPVIAYWAGFKKIGEKEVKHYPRKFGVSKFGWERFINGFVDLLTIKFLGKFGKKPMHFFGVVGVILSLIGMSIMVYLFIGKVFFMQYEMTKRPILYLAILLIIMGLQMFLAGFISELVVRNAVDRNKYNISNFLNI